jgi:hypothetical protein
VNLLTGENPDLIRYYAPIYFCKTPEVESMVAINYPLRTEEISFTAPVILTAVKNSLYLPAE